MIPVMMRKPCRSVRALVPPLTASSRPDGYRSYLNLLLTVGAHEQKQLGAKDAMAGKDAEAKRLDLYRP